MRALTQDDAVPRLEAVQQVLWVCSRRQQAISQAMSCLCVCSRLWVCKMADREEREKKATV